MISPEQMRMLHATAKQAGRDHAAIRDEAADLFGISSLTELETPQASQLIDGYLKEAAPPEPLRPVRKASPFGGPLAKRVSAKADAAPPRAVAAATIHPALVLPPIGKPVPAPTYRAPTRRRPETEVDKIPW